MTFFDRRKFKERRLNKENSKAKNPDEFIEKRSGKDRRKGSDRRQDRYHQMELSKREIVYKIVEILEKEVDDK